MAIGRRHAWRVAATVVLGWWLGLSADAFAQSQQPTDYRLHAGDDVEVSVWKEEDLLRKVIVRPDGKFTFPLAGEILAEGRTVDQIRADIETRLKTFIPEPVVTVSVSGIDGNRIYIIGQVNKPGSYVMNPQINVLQALSVAGGGNPLCRAERHHRDPGKGYQTGAHRVPLQRSQQRAIS